MEEKKAETHTHTYTERRYVGPVDEEDYSKERNRGTLWALHAGLCLQFLLVLVDLVGK